MDPVEQGSMESRQGRYRLIEKAGGGAEKRQRAGGQQLPPPRPPGIQPPHNQQHHAHNRERDDKRGAGIDADAVDIGQLIHRNQTGGKLQAVGAEHGRRQPTFRRGGRQGHRADTVTHKAAG